MEIHLHQKVDGKWWGASKSSRPVQVLRAASAPPGWPLLAGGAYPLRTRWDLRADSGALSGRALDPKRPAQVCDALAHRLQAEVSWERARRIEAPTIVANFQEDLVRVLLQPQLHTLSLGVLERVVQGLLGDAIDCLFYLQRRVWFGAKGHVDRKPVARLHQCRLFFQSSDQALGRQGLRAQLEDQGTHLGQARLGQREHVLQRLGDPVGVPD